MKTLLFEETVKCSQIKHFPIAFINSVLQPTLSTKYLECLELNLQWSKPVITSSFPPADWGLDIQYYPLSDPINEFEKSIDIWELLITVNVEGRWTWLFFLIYLLDDILKKCHFSWVTLNSDCSIARLCWVNLIECKHWSIEQILLCCALSSLLSILKRWIISANRKNKFLVLSNPLDYCRMTWGLPLGELRTC